MSLRSHEGHEGISHEGAGTKDQPRRHENDEGSATKARGPRGDQPRGHEDHEGISHEETMSGPCD